MNQYSNNPKYKIAIVDEDGTVLKVYSQDEYNTHIINSYKQSREISNKIQNENPIYAEPAKPKTQELTISKIVNDGFKPFKVFGGLFVFSVLFVILGGIGYKLMTNKNPNIYLMQFILVVCLGLSFFIAFW